MVSPVNASRWRALLIAGLRDGLLDRRRVGDGEGRCDDARALDDHDGRIGEHAGLRDEARDGTLVERAHGNEPSTSGLRGRSRLASHDCIDRRAGHARR